MEEYQNQSLENAISYCIENFSATEATKRIIDYIKSDRELTEQLCQCNVSGRSEQLCGNLDENYNCKKMCLTRCVDGKEFKTQEKCVHYEAVKNGKRKTTCDKCNGKGFLELNQMWS